MSLLNDLPPRHYADSTVPTRSDGEPMRRTNDQEEYDTYTAWLAEYLFTTDIPLHPRQREYAKHSDTLDPDTAVFHISDWFGYAVWELDMLKNAFEAGEDWLSFDAVQHEAFASFSDEEREELPFDEWAVSRGVWERLREEWSEEKALTLRTDHADIPYRSLLSHILKRLPNREERIAIIRSYFQNFDENASK